MATDVEVTWWPETPYVGGVVTIWATLTPAPPAGAHVWIHVDNVKLGPLEADSDGHALTYWTASSSGQHVVRADATLLDSGEPVNSDPTYLDVLDAPAAGPVPQPTEGAASEQAGVQGPRPEDAGAPIQCGSNAFNGASNINPFTGAPATDPYTGEPLSERDASIYDRIKAVYSQPDAVTESTRHAFLDFYNQPAIDLTGVPQSVQNLVLDIFNQVPETPLPGRGLDEFLNDTFSSILEDVSSGFRSVVGTTSTAIDLLSYADAAGLEATGKALGQVLGPILGAARAIGGVVEMVEGVTVTAGTEGLGAGLGVAMVAHGLDQLIAGGRTIFGQDAQSLAEYIFTDALRPALGTAAPLGAGFFDGGFSLGLSATTAEFGELGGLAVRNLNAEAAATRPELSVATQLAEVQSIVAPAEEMATQASEIRPRIAFISSEWSQGTRAEQMVAALRDEMTIAGSSSEITSISRASSFEINELGAGRIASIGGASSAEFTELGAGRSSVLGPGNRLTIINPDFEPTLSPPEAFQAAQTNIVDKFAQNPQSVGRFLSPREQDALIKAQNAAAVGDWQDLDSLSRKFFGKAVERALGEVGERTELLASIGQSRDARGRFVSSPDFRGLAGWQGLFFESTTNAALDAHLVKGYPATTHYVTYEIPATWRLFLTP
ncbi:hypothetical protein [Variovorax sp. YR216]|uniref:hypothetical protein n=1 Tax=Variovorax sp. YR216 TaxID=1882828 RepID=UPI000897E1FD|nr:hypothetical protein [Variovorax sp. YR216]SEB22722.1 hypothetical protein SAMN05444680_116139 [Variovorax sp. YR216]